MAWRTIVAKFPGTCMVCDKKIEQDEVIHWDPNTKKSKHKDCETVKDKIDLLNDDISSLKGKTIRLFVAGKQDEAMKSYSELSKLEFKETVKQHDVNEDIKFDAEKLAELNKKLESSELKHRAHSMDFPIFLAEFKDTFLSFVRAILGENKFVRISKNLESKKIEAFQHEIAIKYYKKWSETKTYHISPDTPVKNKKTFSMILSKCQNSILWEDRYLEKESITYLLGGVPETVKEIKLLSSIFSKQVDKELKNYFEIVKKEMESNNIDCQMKLLTSKELHGGEHDRYILGTNIGFNSVSVGQIKKDQKSDIFEIKRVELEKRKDDFFKLWNNPKCKDIINDWDEIDQILNEQGLAKSYIRNCSICGQETKVPSYIIQQKKPAICNSCRRR